MWGLPCLQLLCCWGKCTAAGCASENFLCAAGFMPGAFIVLKEGKEATKMWKIEARSLLSDEGRVPSQSDVTECTCWCCYQEAWEKCDWVIAMRMCLWRKEAMCVLLQCFSLPSNIIASFPGVLLKQLFCIYDPIYSSYRAIFTLSHLHCNYQKDW